MQTKAPAKQEKVSDAECQPPPGGLLVTLYMSNTIEPQLPPQMTCNVFSRN